MQPTENKSFLVKCYDYTEGFVRQLLNSVDNEQRFIFSLIGLIPFLTPVTFALGRSVKLTFWSTAVIALNVALWIINAIFPFLGFLLFFLSAFASIASAVFWVYAVFFIVTVIIPDVKAVEKERDTALLNNRQWSGYDIPRTW